MARIRTIKPEFWGDEKLSPLPDATRLLFLGLISMADDFGRLVDNERLIDAFVFPECDPQEYPEGRIRETREGLAQLTRLSRLIRGRTSSGQRVIQISNWSKHQRVDRPSTKSALPEIVDSEDVAPVSEAVTGAAAPPPLAPPATLAREPREILAPRPRTMDLGPRTVDQRSTTPEPSSGSGGPPSHPGQEGDGPKLQPPTADDLAAREVVLASCRRGRSAAEAPAPIEAGE